MEAPSCSLRCRLPFTVLLCACLTFSSSRLSADSLTEEVPVLGGTVALSRAIGLDPVPDRARFMTELTRVIYDGPKGSSSETDVVMHKLADYLQSINAFETALAVLQPAGTSITLAMASRKDDRLRLESFLDVVGLRLREENKAFTVEPARNKPAAEHLAVLTSLGINPPQLATRLNRGEAVHVEALSETVPVPLPARTWSEVVLQRPVGVAGLFSALIADRRAALLCHGLAALDDETLQYLISHRSVLTRLYEHDAAVFAAFAGSLRVRDNAVVPPGGAAATPIWNAALDETVTMPDRFIRELFSRDDGRVAYLYDALTHFDEPTRSFALGLWMTDPRHRVERFKSLLNALDAFPGWTLPERSFRRPPDDPVLMLMRVVVEPGGEPRSPAWRLFWSQVFDSVEIPDDPGRRLRNLHDDGVIDAAWLAESVLNAELPSRGERLDQLAFGLRAFAGIDDDRLPDALVAVRAFPRYRMLMITLERMGIANPAAYAAAARHANRLSALDANHGFIALSQFQGALAILARLVSIRTLDHQHAEALVVSLSAVPVNDDGWYAGGIARWLQHALAPSIGIATHAFDAGLVGSLAGVRAGESPAPTLVSWEERTYRLDLTAPEVRRLTQVIEKLRPLPVSLAIAAEAAAETLSGPGVGLAEVQVATDALREMLGAIGPAQPKNGTKAAALPPGVEARNRRDVVSRAIQDLSRIMKPKDLNKASQVARSVYDLVDDVLAEALISLTYAIDLGDPQGTALLAGNVGRRHDFGFTEKNGEARLRTPWTAPAQQIQPGVPWHVTGSALDLDLGLSSLALRRTSSGALPEAPTLRSADKDVFTETVALLNVFDLGDADRDAIADAIARGRERVGALTNHDNTLDGLADEITLDGWRRRAVGWSLVNDPQRVLSFFSLAELLRLGNPPANAHLDSWGMAASAYNGCVCTKLTAPGRWMLSSGRWPRGTVATDVADLNLRVAVALRELKLPAALAKGVLAAAMQDYVDRVKPLYPDDWLTLVRSAQALSAQRIQDYVSALTASGPLVPDTPGKASNSGR